MLVDTNYWQRLCASRYEVLAETVLVDMKYWLRLCADRYEVLAETVCW